ncbi:MAG: hypothetical protein GDA67_16730 [Nitrospira sp. CR1.3]|nr:hypothetical protein [Nitrospira sp. CR1.3]
MIQSSTQVLDQVAEQLRAEMCRLVDAKNELNEQAHQLDSELKVLRAALGALGDKKRVSREQKNAIKKALTTSEVVSLVESALAKCNGMAVDSLRTEIERQARSNGRTLIGFHLRFGKAIKDERFGIEQDRCYLRA